MAVDANVLVFERAREEYAAAPAQALRTALDDRLRQGAGAPIVDSNVTTLLAAGLLFFLASGPVRGFGVTLTHRRARLDVLRAGPHPGARRARRSARRAWRARPAAHRARHARPGPRRWLHARRPRPDAAPPAVAGASPAIAVVLAVAGHRRARAGLRAWSSPAAGSSSTPPAGRSTSDTRPRRRSPTPGSPARSCRTSGDGRTSRCAPASSTTTTEAAIRDALAEAVGGDVDQGSATS